ncbi:hypothetical protein [Nocardia callitridis]|uniref:hypothetical protein n=1 Tax=Nocardia callitridis TaxID=648753 RepID=UPI0031F1C358
MDLTRLDPLLGGHAPLPVMDLESAHIVMRTRIDCATTLCRIRHQAKLRLVDAGVLVPAAWPNMARLAPLTSWSGGHRHRSTLR